jgi:hypothetical protein
MITSKVEKMIDTSISHEDLEYFASYLGIDYEDYYELIYQLSNEESYDFDIEIPS